jgi:hypothetical protein
MKLERIIRLLYMIHTDNLKAGSVIASGSPSSSAEEIKDSHLA